MGKLHLTPPLDTRRDASYPPPPGLSLPALRGQGPSTLQLLCLRAFVPEVYAGLPRSLRTLLLLCKTAALTPIGGHVRGIK